MPIHQLIFSGQIHHRIIRHGIFWIAYCLFFYVQSIVPTDYSGSFSAFTFYVAAQSVIHFLPACILFVYVSLYYILPRLIINRKVVSSILAILLLFAFCTLINIPASDRFNKLTPPNIQAPINFEIVFGLAYLNAAWAFTAGGIAIGIKVVKSWIIQQRNIVEVERNTTRKNIELLKNRVFPRFLLTAIESIRLKVGRDKLTSAHMVIIMSDLLSSILNESSEELIESGKELFILQQYIAFENLSHPGRMLLEVDSMSTFYTKYLPPLSLLSFVQNCIAIIECDGLSPGEWKIRIKSDSRLKLSIVCKFQNSGMHILHAKHLQHRVSEMQGLFLPGTPPDTLVRVIHNSVVLSGKFPFSPKTMSNLERVDTRVNQIVADV